MLGQSHISYEGLVRWLDVGYQKEKNNELQGVFSLRKDFQGE